MAFRSDAAPSGDLLPEGWRTGVNQDDARRRAKFVNFGCSLLVRAFLMVCAGLFYWREMMTGGLLGEPVTYAMVAMMGDFTRVLAKALTPGTK